MGGKGLLLALFLALGAGGGGILLQQSRTASSVSQGVLSANTKEPSSSCQSVYGGGATCVQTGKVILNKTIQHPNSSDLVESLSINDPKFKANQAVIFHLTLTNTDTKEAKNITVKDTLPSLLTYVSGDGQFDEKTQTFSFTVDLLKPGESKTHIVQMKVLPAEKLPKQTHTTCIINQARTINNGNISQDNVQFCIENKVLAASIVYPPQELTQTPPTGASGLALLLLLPAGLGAGLFFRSFVPARRRLGKLT